MTVVLQLDDDGQRRLFDLFRRAVRVRGLPLEVTMQKPSLGQIVLVPADPALNNGADVAPAMITRVWSDTLVNVRVLLDGHEVPWKTSIPLFAGPDELAEAKARRDAEHPVWTGELFYGAFWPPQV